MRLEQGLKAALEADADVSALVSARVYLERMPQTEVYPCIVFNRISTSQGGLLSEVETLTEVRIQVDCWAESYPVLYDLAKKVRTLLSGYQGDMGGVSVQWSKFENEVNASDFDGDEVELRQILNFTFWLHE